MKWCLKQWCLLCCAAPVKTVRKWYINGTGISPPIQRRQLSPNSASLILPNAHYSEDSAVFKCVTTTEYGVQLSSIIYNVTVVGKCHLLQRLSMRLVVCAKKILQPSYFRVEKDRPFSLGMSSKKKRRHTCQSVTSFGPYTTKWNRARVGLGVVQSPIKVNSIFNSSTGKVLRIKGMAFPSFPTDTFGM